nr:hypothetical protein [Micromonospora sp. DSM 115978]
MSDSAGPDDPQEPRPASPWRPINERRIGGRLPWMGRESEGRIPVPPFPTGTLSGPGATREVVPDTIPGHAEEDTLRMLLARHEPADEYVCKCGQPLGEDTGLCYYARQAQKRLYDVILDRKAYGEEE